eukprot:1382919-Amorphochlora_amoeboformis.AAC.1
MATGEEIARSGRRNRRIGGLEGTCSEKFVLLHVGIEMEYQFFGELRGGKGGFVVYRWVRGVMEWGSVFVT